MKFRNGFVSNSSTTSFCIYGAYISEEANKPEGLSEKIRELGLSIEYPQFDDGFYLGCEWANIGGDETGNQFKKKIEDAIEQVLGKRLECETHEESYYDG